MLRTLLGWALAAASTVVLGGLAVIIPGRELTLRMGRLWAKSCLVAAGVRLRVVGADRLDLSQPLVIMANHQSAVDIPSLMVAVPAALRCAIWSRDDLFAVPFLGHGMRGLGFVPVDRTSRRSAASTLATSRELIKRGRSVLAFPEQTYGPRDRLLPFQRGAFLLALKSGAPILPVGVQGADAVLPPRAWLVKPGVVEVRFGAAIEVAGLGPSARAAVETRVREAIAELSDKST